MRANGLQEVWLAGRYALNAWASIGSSYAVEVLANLPYDAVTVDLQHGMFDFDIAVSMLQAISTSRAVPMVRVQQNSAAAIHKVLDMGAYGVICPLIDTAEECASFVQAMRYPPLGNRSFGPARGLLYGGPDYAAAANGILLSWAMIETEKGLSNVEEIASVEGLSGLYVGPSDLSMTLEGSVSSPLSPRICREVARVVKVAHSRGIRAGVFCPDSAFAREMIALGCDLVTVMNDVGLLRRATNALLEELGTRSAPGISDAARNTFMQKQAVVQ